MSKLLYRNFTTTTISNTSSETLFFSYTISKGVLKDDRLVRAELACFIESNTGTAREFDYRFEFSDGTNTTNVAIDDMGPYAGNLQCTFDVELLAQNFLAQKASVRFFAHAGDGTNDVYTQKLGSPTLDQSKDITVKGYVTMATASASLTFTNYWHYVELV